MSCAIGKRSWFAKVSRSSTTPMPKPAAVAALAAANRPRNRAILAHQHARTFVAWDRAVRVHDRSQRRAPPGPPHLHDFFEQVHVSPQSSAYGARVPLSIIAIRIDRLVLG